MFADDGRDGDPAALSAARRRLVPRMDLLHDAALRLLPDRRPDEPYRVLDIGTGTGLLVGRLLEAIPEARVHLVHNGAASLKAARERLAAFGDRAGYELAEYVRADFGGPYDVAITELSASFLENRSKRTLLSATYAALRRGGRAINVIQARGATEESEAVFAREWEKMARELGATDADIAGSIVSAPRGRTATLAQQLEWMAADGFENVDCYLKFWRFAVVAGDKL